MSTKLARFNETGATATEYDLIVALVAIGRVAALNGLRKSPASSFSLAANARGASR